MPSKQERIERVLTAHRVTWDLFLTRCKCGGWVLNRAQHTEHVAAAILAEMEKSE